MVQLCIAEKPSVAREIARVLAAGARRDGYFEGNNYLVSWTYGHLCSLLEPGDYADKWRRWSLDSLPILPERFDIKLLENSGARKQFAVIRELVGRADVVINCGDAGQEGELIQRWVLSLAANTKPVRRLWISSLTDEAIREGFRSLTDSAEFDNLYRAGESRARGDWLLGMNATRLYTLNYAAGGGVLSVGRVQTPTLAMLVQRHLEIANFKPQPYWELHTRYRDTQFEFSGGRFDNESKAAAILTEIREKKFAITEVEIREGKEFPPRLFDLTSLQVECNRKLALSAEETLKILQELYEGKAISYPRVDTRYLPQDLHPKVPGILAGLEDFADICAPLLAEALPKNPGVFNDTKISDHHAIIPTGQKPGRTGKHRKVYDMIAKRFIAVFYPPCSVSRSSVKGQSEGHEFQAKGKTILDPGWRTVYAGEKAGKDEDGEQLLPNFREGESGEHSPELLAKMTKAPNNYTEASLLRAMETAGKTVDDDELRDLMKENGLGRPSTRAAIIETLFKRGYIQRSGKKLLATQTGIQLIGLIQDETLKSAELTGLWERKLRQIERGEFSPEAFITEMNTMITGLVQAVRAQENPHSVITAQPQPHRLQGEPASVPKSAIGACPKCRQGTVIEGKKGYGCNRWREGCQFVIWKVIAGKKLTGEHVLQLVEKGCTKLIRGFRSKDSSKSFAAVLRLDAEHKVVFDFNAADEERSLGTCPKCRKGTIIEGKKGYGCTRWREGCDFTVWKEIAGKKLTKKQVRDLLSKGRTESIKGFSSKTKNKEFDAVLRLDKDYKVVFAFWS